MGGNWTCDHLAIDKNTESLYRIPKMNRMRYINYISIKTMLESLTKQKRFTEDGS